MLCIYAFEIGEFINHFYSFRSRNQSLLSAPGEGGGGKSLKSVSLLSWSMDMVSQGGRGGEGAGGGERNPSSAIMTGPWIRRLSTFASCSCSFMAGVPMNDNSSGYDWKYTHTKKQPPPLKKKGKNDCCLKALLVFKRHRSSRMRGEWHLRQLWMYPFNEKLFIAYMFNPLSPEIDQHLISPNSRE